MLTSQPQRIVTRKSWNISAIKRKIEVPITTIVCATVLLSGNRFVIASTLRFDGQNSSEQAIIRRGNCERGRWDDPPLGRSEEHTSELQSRPHLVCRLLLEKKNNQ